MEKFADESKKDKSRSIKKDVRDIKEDDDNTIWKVIKDARKEENKNQKIDHFTFFAYLSKGKVMTPKFLRFLKKDWGLKPEISNNEYSAFLFPSMKGDWWCFDGHQRENIPKLWALFDDILNNRPLTKEKMEFIPSKGVLY